MIYEIANTDSVSPLFARWEETLIWSCLQGIMGKIYADALADPTAAMAVLGDFTFFAGKPNAELASYKPGWCTRNLYPSRDAQNKESAALAEKLGYHFCHPYTAIEVRD